MKIKGIGHVELTVSDIERSKKFYSKLPGLKIVAEYPNFVMFFGGSLYLGLTDHNGKIKERVFNEENVGLDHFAFEVEAKEDLNEAMSFFDSENIPHGNIEELSNHTFVLAFRDPDNIQLELAWRKK